MRSFHVTSAAALLIVAVPAFATPEQDIQRAYQAFDRGRYAEAKDRADAYLRTYPRRFSASFIRRASNCLLRTPRRGNGDYLAKLREEYVVNAEQQRAINRYVAKCNTPVPPPPPQQAGVSASGMTVGLGTAIARPGADEPPLRRAPQ